jgi:AcrR family transcriptional regulator
MGIYARFHSKAGLTLHVLAEGFARLQTAIATTGPTAREALRRSGVAYRVFAHEHPALYRLMFAQKLTFDDATLADVVRSAGLEAFGTLVELARAYLDEAAITTFDPVDVAMLFWSVVHGFVSLELDDHQFGDDHDANFVCLLEVALEGVRVTHAR